MALDAGKESIVIDFQQSVDVDQFDRLASPVDIVLLSTHLLSPDGVGVVLGANCFRRAW